MRRNFAIFCLIICTIFFGCKKNDSLNGKISSTVILKIIPVSGGGQTDTIGNPLANPIMVQVTANGIPMAGYSVQFKGSGCNQDNIASTTSQNGGMASYAWSLSGDAGSQTLTAYVLNSDNKRVDSVKINATALAPGPGWHNAACTLQTGLTPASFCKLSTGRLFTCFAGGKSSLRYSDDNGISWPGVASLGAGHQVSYVIASASDEVYAFTNDGLFYSKDAGQSWTNVSTPAFDSSTITAAIVTLSGKVMVTCNAATPLYISTDKGKNWTAVANSAFPETQAVTPHFYCPAEDKDGRLFVTDKYNENVFVSADGGATWNMPIIAGSPSPGITYSFYIDPNNIFYESCIFPGKGIFVSDDKGAGYSGYMITGENYGNMSLQSDGNFYFEDEHNGLYKFHYYNVGTLLFPFNDTGLQPYIVAKNNNLIVANTGKPYIRYYSK